MNNRINHQETAARYNSLTTITDDDDFWHVRTKNEIRRYIQAFSYKNHQLIQHKILNAGSAGDSYGLQEENMMHVDVASRHIAHLPNSVVCNIENLPFEAKEFDLIICVGSVLNYCDPILVMKEFSRVLKEGGKLILEFESSRTFELLFTKSYGQSAVFVETFFDPHGDKEMIWYFSDDYIFELASTYGFTKIQSKAFHILSPLVYRLTNHPHFSSYFSKLDDICRRIPWVKRNASNLIATFELGGLTKRS